MMARATVLLALVATTLLGEIVAPSPSTIGPCGDVPVFCYGEPGECKGLVDAAGNVVRRWQRPFRIFGPFSEGLLAVEHPNSKLVGFLDTEGRWAIKPRFESAGPFRSGLSRVYISGKSGFIGKTGDIVIEPRFEEVTDFDNGGYARFYVGREYYDPSRRVGVIDRTGAVVVEPRLFAISEFAEGVAAAVLEGPCWQEKEYAFDSSDFSYLLGATKEQHRGHGNDSGLPHCRWSLIDSRGKAITESKYLNIGEFSEGLAPARVDEGWGYIDSAGEMEIEPRRFEAFPITAHMLFAHPFSKGLAAIFDINLGWIYIDRKGETQLRATNTEFVGDFKDGLALVPTREYDTWRFLDRSGNAPFEDIVGTVTPFCHGVAHVSLGPGEGDGFYREALIDTKGQTLFSWKWY